MFNTNKSNQVKQGEITQTSTLIMVGPLTTGTDGVFPERTLATALALDAPAVTTRTCMYMYDL